MDDFEKELKAGFLEEAAQLLADAEQSFLSLESNPGDSALLDKIFRLAHNFKGSAKAVGFEAMGAFAHVFESFLLKLKNGEVTNSSPVISLLLRCNDYLNISVKTLQADMNALVDGSALLAELEDGMKGKFQEIAPTVTCDADTLSAPDSPEETLSVSEVGNLLEAETTQQLALSEATIAPKAPVAVAPMVPSGPAVPGGKGADESIRVSLARLEKLINIVGEMVILQTVLREQVFSSDPTLLRRTAHQLGKVTKEVQDISMSLRMVPVKQTFQKMQRIVRDTANLLGKNIQLHLQGEETELDKTVLESISDPLVHLIRNAADHGIETAEVRRERGKAAEGNIHLGARHESGKLLIEIRDDGGGIDGERLYAKAVEKGVIAQGAPMSEKDRIHLIFHPGFSTKQEVTEVSGRGVGMDVVRTNIEMLQGEIHIATEVGMGTTFQVLLPLTLAIIDGMVVRCSGERFVIPLAQVHESMRPSPGDVQFNVGLGEVLMLRGECLPLFRLNSVLGRKSASAVNDSIAIVIRSSGKPFAILVDDIVGQYQIVIKKLGQELSKLKIFSGSAVLGDGRPAFILDPSELAKVAVPLTASQFHTKSSERVAA